MNDAVIRRFIDKIAPQPSGCWEWTARRNAEGYGYFALEYRMRRAHRVAYELLVGPIPHGLELDHVCQNRSCVNPDHLDPVTHAENMRRSRPAQQTHCKRGHEFTDANTYVDARSCRRCRACDAFRTAKRRAA